MASFTAAPALSSLTFISSCEPRDAAWVRPGSHPSHHLGWSSGERCGGLFMWPLSVQIHDVSPLCTYQANDSPLPHLRSIMEQLLIYISGRDASQLVFAAWNWYSPPPLALNDFLRPLVSFPLSCYALHNSSWSLDPSNTNDHHLFPSAAVSFFHICPVAHFDRRSATLCSHFYPDSGEDLTSLQWIHFIQTFVFIKSLCVLNRVTFIISVNEWDVVATGNTETRVLHKTISPLGT